MVPECIVRGNNTSQTIIVVYSEVKVKVEEPYRVAYNEESYKVSLDDEE